MVGRARPSSYARFSDACTGNPSWHICCMTVLFKCRVNPRHLKRASKVTADLGTSLPEVVRIFLAEIARTGTVPVSMSTGSHLINKQARNRVLRSLDDTEAW